MKRANKWLTLGVGAALALTVAAGAAPTFAQTAPTTPSAQVAPASVAAHRGFGNRGGNHDELLAKELGITVEQLTAARSTARDKALAAAVADGSITQAQADLIKARHALKASIDQQAILADALNMTVAELETAQADGQRLSAIIEAQGLDAATVQAAVQQGYEAAVAAAVKDGTITQAQADTFLAEPMRGPGGRHGFRGLFGRQR